MKIPSSWKKLSAHRLYRKQEAFAMRAQKLQDIADKLGSMAYAKGERRRKAAFKRLPPEEQKRRLEVERFNKGDTDIIMGMIAAQLSATSPLMEIPLKKNTP